MESLEPVSGGNKNTEKINAAYSQITVSGPPERPYFAIVYFDRDDGEWHHGFGSFSLAYVQNWLREEFEPEHGKLSDAITDLLRYKDAIERMGEFGKLFLSYTGDPRGPVGRSGDRDIAKEVQLQPVIIDVDGGKWRPVNEDALQDLLRQLDRWKEQNFRSCKEKGELRDRAEKEKRELANESARFERDAWEPCGYCNGAKWAYGNITVCIPRGEKRRSETEVEGYFDYCPVCGYPLTEEAWAKLRKRLRG